MNETKRAAAEAATLITADNHRETWDGEDLEFVAAFRDEASEELAYALGRSLYAIESIKRVIDERMTKEVARRNVEARAAARTYTFIDGDVPEDW